MSGNKSTKYDFAAILIIFHGWPIFTMVATRPVVKIGKVHVVTDG